MRTHDDGLMAQGDELAGAGRGEKKTRDEFERAMRRIYERAKTEAGYNATYYLSMLAEHGGLGTAKRLLAATKPRSKRPPRTASTGSASAGSSRQAVQPGVTPEDRARQTLAVLLAAAADAREYATGALTEARPAAGPLRPIPHRPGPPLYAARVRP